MKDTNPEHDDMLAECLTGDSIVTEGSLGLKVVTNEK